MSEKKTSEKKLSYQKNTSQEPYAVLGGTFNPVHYAHLHLALAIKEMLTISKVYLMPCYQPVPNKKHNICASHRLALLKTALNSNNLFKHNLAIDTREIDSKLASYTIVSLTQMRAQLGLKQPLIFVLGVDAFNCIDTWQQWQNFLSLCHILVAHRPNTKITTKSNIINYMHKHNTNDINILKSTSCGYIMYKSLTQLDISSTMIRNNMRDSLSVHTLLPTPTIDYIKQHNLYT